MMNKSDRLKRSGVGYSSIIDCKAKFFGVIVATILLLCAAVICCAFFVPNSSAADTVNVAEISYVTTDADTGEEITVTQQYTTFNDAFSAAVLASNPDYINNQELNENVIPVTVKLINNATFGGNTVYNVCDITLDMNGYVLTSTAPIRMWSRQLNENGTALSGGENLNNKFTLKDSNPTKQNNVTVNGGQHTYSGGVFLGSGNYATQALSLSRGTYLIDGCNFVGFKQGINASQSYESLTVKNSVFQYNSGSYSGGGLSAIGSSNSTVYIENCKFLDNKADANTIYGGALYATGSTAEGVQNITIKDTVISGNILGSGTNSAARGGGLAITGNALLDNVTITNNSTTADGGGIYLKNSKVVLQSCDISENSVSGYTYARGGGVHVDGGATVVMNSGRIYKNSGSENGGGVYVNGGTFELHGGTISENTSVEQGGGVYVNNAYTSVPSAKYNAVFLMTGGEISNNTTGTGKSTYATSTSGAVYIYTNGSSSFGDTKARAYLHGGSIINNKAYKESDAGKYSSAGIRISDKSELYVSGSPVVYNNTSPDGRQRNITLAKDATIKFDGKLKEDAKLGVCFHSTYVGLYGADAIDYYVGQEGILTDGYDAEDGVEMTDVLLSDYSQYDLRKNADGEAELVLESTEVTIGGNTTVYKTFADAIAALSGKSGDVTIRLLQDAVLDTEFVVATGVNITLDLNGRLLTRRNGYTSYFTVNVGGALTIEDGNPDIEHKYYFYSGYDHYRDNIAFFALYNCHEGDMRTMSTMRGGIICTNYHENPSSSDPSAKYRPAVTVNAGGVLVLNSGRFMGNRLGSTIQIEAGGEFDMNGGTVAYNGSSNYNYNAKLDANPTGAVYVKANAVIKLSGAAVIADNYYNQYKDYAKSGNVIVSGTFEKSFLNNVYLAGGGKLQFGGDLEDGAEFGVTTDTPASGVIDVVITNGFGDNNGGLSMNSVFKSDAGKMIVSAGGEAAISYENYTFKNLLILDNMGGEYKAGDKADLTVMVTLTKESDGKDTSFVLGPSDYIVSYDGGRSALKAGNNTVTVTYTYDGVDHDESIEINDIAQQSIDLSNAKTFNWQLAGYNAMLLDGKVYVYGEEGSYVYYYSLHEELGEPTRVINVKQSIVRDRGTELTVELDGADELSNVMYTPNSQKGQAVGVYTTRVMLTLKDTANYVYTGNGAYVDRGLNITITGNGTVATITKTWYILQIDNGLKSQSAATYGDEYDIASWTFGDNVTVDAPRLEHGDEGETGTKLTFGEDDTRVSFTLLRNGTQVGETFYRYNFGEYVNKTMPIGDYTLNVEVDKIELENETHTHWWDGSESNDIDNGLVYSAFPAAFAFSVRAARLNVTDDIKGKTYTYAYDGKMHLYSGADAPAATLAYADSRQGIWADSQYNGYYDQTIQIEFNLKRWANGEFMTVAAMSALTAETNKLTAVGEYAVRYRITAKNYTVYGSTGVNDDEFVFTVKITAEQETPEEPDEPIEVDLSKIKFEDGSFVYNGNAHSIFVNGAPEFIKVEYTGNGKVEIGEYEVTAKLSADSDKYKLVGKTELTATLTILAKTLEIPKDEDSDKVWVSAETDKGFVPGVELNISELPNYKHDKIEDDIEAAYDISLKQGGQTVTPAGKVTISLLIPEELRNQDFAIMQIKGDKVDPVTYLRSGDYAMFTVDSLSAFAFVKQQAAAPAPANDDNGMWWIWVIIGVLALLIIILLLILLVHKKKKADNDEPPAPPAPAPAPAPAPIASSDANSEATEAANKIAAAAAIVAEAAAKVAEAKLASAQAGSAATTQAPAAAPETAPQPKPAPAPAQTDDDDEATPEVDEDDTEVPSDDGFAGAFEASSTETVTYSQSVLSKLISSTDAVKNRYSELKNYLLSYKKARANMSRARESFYIGRNCYARIAVRGKTLCVYLALDPQKYAGTKYNVEDVLGVKSYADTPCLLRIKSERALKLAKELIDELMSGIEAEKYDRKEENYVALFKSIEMLQKKKLISCSGNKKKK